MNINRNNYEEYFIDYLEGNLAEKLVDDFLEFLQQNPDLKEELSLFQSVSLEPEEIQFNKKEKLFKNKFDLEDQFNHFSVALLEGDLKKDEKEEFESYLNSHPEKKKEYKLFEKTKLQPDLSVKFRKKSSLYHRSVGKSIVMWSVRIAAVFVLAFSFYVFIDQYSGKKLYKPKVAANDAKTQQNKTDKKETSKEIQQQSASVNEKVQIPEVQLENKPAENKAVTPVQKSTKSIRENNTERMDKADMVIKRIPFEPLEPISRLTALLETKQPPATLKSVEYAIPEEAIYQDDERFLADVIKEKTGIDKLSFNKVAKAGLNIVSSISKEKLTYETNESGKVTEISYDSRLLAFSIPTRGEPEK